MSSLLPSLFRSSAVVCVCESSWKKPSSPRLTASTFSCLISLSMKAAFPACTLHVAVGISGFTVCSDAFFVFWLTSCYTKSMLCLTEQRLSQHSLLWLLYKFVPSWVLMGWPTARSLIKEKKRPKVYFLITTLNNDINGSSIITLYNLILVLIMNLF